ncbi:MAG: UvrD-helicase domain-containing protein [Anaerolineales bacterium]
MTVSQRAIANAPVNEHLFVAGPAGSGKTTAGVRRLLRLLKKGVPASEILVLVPQRTLGFPYAEALRASQAEAGGETSILTVGGLARRMTELFWPLAVEAAGFAHPERPPTFLTLETAQYYMAHLVRPLFDQGYFESVVIDRNRLYAQILDNLNKAAAVGFPHTEIGDRLAAAWSGDPAQRRVYADAQECANRFRAYCLEYNLLDFSLQLEIFLNLLWPQEIVRTYLTRAYRHLIYDNVEEDIPRAHDLLLDWLPHFDSALVIRDDGGGYRMFLGADPLSADRFRQAISRQMYLDDNHVQNPPVAALEARLSRALAPAVSDSPPEETDAPACSLLHAPFYPDLLDKIVAQTAALLADGVPPAEIAILAPYLSDALRFALLQRLEAENIPARSHRPSRSLRDEPASQALLTLAALAHPAWGLRPARFDVAYALMFALETDLVRAQLLAEIVYRPKDAALTSFDQIKTEVQERITYRLGNRYTLLRAWLDEYRQAEPLPLDHFLRRLFGEVLSQPGFGFHRNYDAVRVAASLIESVRKFRLAMQPVQDATVSTEAGREYVDLLQEGVIAAQYLESWRADSDEAVLVAPAYTFLMMNRPVRIQFWLDIGSSGWSERLAQPLTQPYVLSRNWEPGRLWTDADEVAAGTAALVRLLSGLLRRCREHVFLGLTNVGETGFEQRGALLRALQVALQPARNSP